MAVRYEDMCVGCPPERGCLGSSCPNRDVPIYYCDRCEDEGVELFEFEGQELCIDCIKELLTKVN